MSRPDKRVSWERKFLEALENDGWGQVEEAEEAYFFLVNQVKKELEENTLNLQQFERTQLAKLTSMLNLRVKELRTGMDLGVGKAACDELKDFFKTFLVNTRAEFPFDVAPEAVGEAPVSAIENLDLNNETTEVEGGSLLPPLQLRRRGDMALTIKIEKMGFKDITEFIDPFITVSVVDKKGNLVESEQDTPVTNKKEPNHILFNNMVHIQTPINQLEPGSAILLEFKHYKPKKKKVSTRAWCFLDLDELETAQLTLEIYKKPTDVKRKTLNLLSVKPLYLHIDMNVRTQES